MKAIKKYKIWAILTIFGFVISTAWAKTTMKIVFPMPTAVKKAESQPQQIQPLEETQENPCADGLYPTIIEGTKFFTCCPEGDTAFMDGNFPCCNSNAHTYSSGSGAHCDYPCPTGLYPVMYRTGENSTICCPLGEFAYLIGDVPCCEGDVYQDEDGAYYCKNPCPDGQKPGWIRGSSWGRYCCPEDQVPYKLFDSEGAYGCCEETKLFENRQPGMGGLNCCENGDENLVYASDGTPVCCSSEKPYPFKYRNGYQGYDCCAYNTTTVSGAPSDIEACCQEEETPVWDFMDTGKVSCCKKNETPKEFTGPEGEEYHTCCNDTQFAYYDSGIQKGRCCSNKPLEVKGNESLKHCCDAFGTDVDAYVGTDGNILCCDDDAPNAIQLFEEPGFYTCCKNKTDQAFLSAIGVPGCCEYPKQPKPVMGASRGSHCCELGEDAYIKKIVVDPETGYIKNGILDCCKTGHLYIDGNQYNCCSIETYTDENGNNQCCEDGKLYTDESGNKQCCKEENCCEKAGGVWCNGKCNDLPPDEYKCCDGVLKHTESCSCPAEMPKQCSRDDEMWCCDNEDACGEKKDECLCANGGIRVKNIVNSATSEGPKTVCCQIMKDTKDASKYTIAGAVDGKCCGGYTVFSSREIDENSGYPIVVRGTSSYAILQNKTYYCARSSNSEVLSFTPEGPGGQCTGKWDLIYVSPQKWCEIIDHTLCGDPSGLTNCRCAEEGDPYSNGIECDHKEWHK